MLRGTIDDFSLPDIFRLLSFTKKTGKLVVWRSAGDGKVFFRDGEVYFAQSSLKKEPLGQKLIRSGALTEGQLRKALDINASTGRRVGEILLDQEAITEEQLIAAVKGQIEDACFDLLRWELGEFDFEAHERFTVEIPISVSVENLIMEASRRLDELEMIRRRIPTPEVVLTVAPTPPEGAREINIAPDEWRLLVLVDGQRSVGEICQLANLDEFTGLRTMYGLLSAGLVDIASLGPEPDPSPVARPEPMNAATDELVPPPVPPPAPVVETDVDRMIVRGPDEVIDLDPVIPPPPSFDVEVEEPVEPPAAYEPGFEIAEPGTVSILESTDKDYVDESAQDEVESSDDEPEAEAQGDGFEVPALEADLESGVEAGADEASFEDAPYLKDPVAPEWLGEVAPEVAVEGWPEESVPAPTNGFAESSVLDVTNPFLDEVSPEPDEAAPEPDEAPEAIDHGVLEDTSEVVEDTPPMPPFDVPAGDDEPTSEPAPRVDRAAVVRELASLFSDEEEQPRRPRASADDPEDEVPDGYVKRRVEDDDQINKGLIGRFIDGVKGM
jgi:hypothetical protein